MEMIFKISGYSATPVGGRNYSARCGSQSSVILHVSDEVR